MSELSISFNAGGEEVLRFKETGEILLLGKEIGGDGTLYPKLLKWHSKPAPEDDQELPEESKYMGPGTTTFWIKGEDVPIIGIELTGVRIYGELTENFDRIVTAFHKFLDKSREEASE